MNRDWLGEKPEGATMGDDGPRELSKLFEQFFAEGDLDRLMTLYEDDAMFPTSGSTAWLSLRS